ncbi:MAG: ribose 5-phosphate isomerase B [Desulfuromusa sp.]|nr:ribose 5-phosphate isomerase B [Desulfuromusa sp.]
MLVLGSDHGGYELKTAILEMLQEKAVECTDLGTNSSASVDYPDFAAKVASAVSSGEAQLGILICGTGIGMSISANKFSGVRAALVHDEFTAQMAREHNNANILVMGGRVLTPEKGKKLVEVWLAAEFAGGRHQQRLDKISAIEQKVIKD